MAAAPAARCGSRMRATSSFQGPGPLVQVFRINTTHGPFRNAKFRQAFNYLIDRQGILRVGYAGLGEVVALPWAPASPAFDKSYNETYAFNIDKAKALLAASGLSRGRDERLEAARERQRPGRRWDQPGRPELAREGRHQHRARPAAGRRVHRCAARAAFDAVFGGVGNIQKFPTRWRRTASIGPPTTRCSARRIRIPAMSPRSSG